MADLITASQFADADVAYNMLVDAHRGLDDEASKSLNAALVLILANHIGDVRVLEQALAVARVRGTPETQEVAG